MGSKRDRWQALMTRELAQAYGRGQSGPTAWNHMSLQQRRDMWLAAGATIVMAQDAGTAVGLSYQTAQEVLEFAGELARELEQ